MQIYHSCMEITSYKLLQSSVFLITLQIWLFFHEMPEFQKLFLSLNTALSFKTTSIILVILRKTIIFAHSDAGSTASGVSFYRSYKIIFVGGNQMRQRSFFDFRLNFRYAKIRFILLICNILHV